ncbi:MAG TPA: phospholipase A [Noviherbaspirillum sp.]|nr:phospholipase A [Noviherbaspirillum sp.]
MRTLFRTGLAPLLLCIAVPVLAVADPPTLAGCAEIADDERRLDCFDRLAAASSDKTPDISTQLDVPQSALPGPVTKAEVQAVVPEASTSALPLADQWELAPEYKRGTFHFRPHRANYLVATYSHAPNDAPYRALRNPALTATGLSHAELAFQLGFKMKLVENVMQQPVDLWFGYTQQSFWQADNREASSPFRETNYQPEVMAVMPVNFALLGMRARFVNLGLVHHSNGQASTLSRSWNRVYAQLGMERGNFMLTTRVWKRLPEDLEEDDNPDIEDYMGYGDIEGTYRWQGHEFSLLGRYNFHTDKGAAQLGWAFPLTSKLKGYVQLFSGYGHSLIDYNYAQKVIGLGVLIDY